jgi:hypothetical protein
MVENVRVDGKPAQRHIAYLGAHSLAVGDNPFTDRELASVFNIPNAVGAAALTSPVWGPYAAKLGWRYILGPGFTVAGAGLGY